MRRFSPALVFDVRFITDCNTDCTEQRREAHKYFSVGASAPTIWKDAGVVDRDGLENRCTLTGTQGSNPCLSAKKQPARLLLFVIRPVINQEAIDPEVSIQHIVGEYR